MATGSEFAAATREMVGCGYALGAQGEVLTDGRLAQLVKWNGRSHYYFLGYSAEKWLGKVCFDCSGLVVKMLQDLGVFGKGEDFTAHALWTHEVVPITKTQLAPGNLLFHWDGAKMSHVGIYLGNNAVVEAKGTKYGVVLSPMPGSWTHFGSLKRLATAPQKAPASAPAPHKLIELGARGTEVTLAQQLLNKKMAVVKGFKKLEEDGIFGKLTDAATRQFQKLGKLAVDGEIGPQTWGALLN